MYGTSDYYDYDEECRAKGYMDECPHCHGTGLSYFIALSTGDGECDEDTQKEVDKATYDACPDPYDAPAGVWCQFWEDSCEHCNGEGWIDPHEAEEMAREMEIEAREEERMMEEWFEREDASC
ncbi:MAG: hypothetical protein LUE27_01875 [Clostridia bacterium]|nr:hypothetical protein [Clostridia bacterium]